MIICKIQIQSVTQIHIRHVKITNKNYHESGHMVKYKIRIHHVLSKNSDMVKLKKLFIPYHFLKKQNKKSMSHRKSQS